MKLPEPIDSKPKGRKESILAKTDTGAIIKRMNPEHVHVDFKSIKSVGLENILDVDSHNINTILNSRSHFIKFRNGGELTFAYNANGELIDLCAKKVSLFISNNDELIFSIKTHPHPYLKGASFSSNHVNFSLQGIGRPSPLTARETVILKMLATGMPLKKVAIELKLSVLTIGGYTKSIYRKLGVKSKMHAVNVANSEGWLG